MENKDLLDRDGEREGRGRGGEGGEREKGERGLGEREATLGPGS